MRYVQRLFVVSLFALLIVAVVSAQETNRVGETILLQGQVHDTDGEPIVGAEVEIWHTDINGNYNHPNDASADMLLDDFQYFGTASTDEDGYYAFLTIKPAAYDNRPTHIHFKVKIDAETVLTSQFYFEEDREVVEQDRAYDNAGDTLFLQTVDSTDADGNPLRIATGNIVIDQNGDAPDTLTATAEQTEGPYYPVVDFSDYDNNLISTAEDDTPIEPVLTVAMEFMLLNLNTASDDEFLSIPDMSNRMVREFNEYRPYISILQFRREIGKYVSEEQVAAYEEYVYVPVNVNESDADTLMQIPGVDIVVAAELVGARPYESNDAFLEKLAEFLTAEQVSYAANYLEAE